MVMCIAQQSNPTYVLYYEAFSPKTCLWSWFQPSQKKGCRNGAVAQGSRTLKHFCLQECPILCYCSTAPTQRNRFTLPWVTSPKQEIGQCFMMASSW